MSRRRRGGSGGGGGGGGGGGSGGGGGGGDEGGVGPSVRVVAISLEDLELRVRCPVCLAVRDDYRLLPCLHAVCLGCVLELVARATEDAPFACPVDRRRVAGLTAEAARALPQDVRRLRERDLHAFT